MKVLLMLLQRSLHIQFSRNAFLRKISRTKLPLKAVFRLHSLIAVILFMITAADVECYFGILLFASVVKVNAFRDLLVSVCECWLVSDCTSFINFERVRSMLHFNDNKIMVLDKDVKYDCLHKLLLVLVHLIPYLSRFLLLKTCALMRIFVPQELLTPFVSR